MPLQVRLSFWAGVCGAILAMVGASATPPLHDVQHAFAWYDAAVILGGVIMGVAPLNLYRLSGK